MRAHSCDRRRSRHGVGVAPGRALGTGDGCAVAVGEGFDDGLADGVGCGVAVVSGVGVGLSDGCGVDVGSAMAGGLPGFD